MQEGGRNNDSAYTDLLDTFTDAWNRHDVDALMDCMTEECVFEASGGPEQCGRRHEGQAAVRLAYQDIFTAFPDAAWNNVFNFIAGDRACSEWTFTGTTADGLCVEVDGCDLFHFVSGRIALKNSFRKNRTG